MNTSSTSGPSPWSASPPPPHGPPAPRGEDHVSSLKAPIRKPNDIAKSLVAGVVAVGFLFDRALYSGSANSLAWALLFVGVSVLIFLSGMAQTKASRVALLGSVFFASMLAVRTEPRLVVFNYLGVVTLWFVVTVFGRKLEGAEQRRFFHYRPSQSVADAGAVLSNCFVSVSEGLTEGSARSQRRSERSPEKEGKREGVLRGILIAGPIVTILFLLLSSADMVFQSMFQIDMTRLSPVGRHLIPALVGSLLVAAVIFVTGRGGADRLDYQTPKMGFTEIGIVLGAINVLYALFAISQAVALSGAGKRIITDSGLTFKEYARHGFFQLLWVAGLTLLILIVANTVTSSAVERERRILRGLSYVTVVLTLILVGVAIRRLALYIGDNGLTPLRFYSSVFSVWVGVAFLIVGTWVARKATTDAWLMPALVISGMLTLAGLNLANPEAIIATTNIERDEASLLFHMDKQTEDGNAVLAANTDRLSVNLADSVEARLCLDYDQADRIGFWGWNLGRASAQSALSDLCS